MKITGIIAEYNPFHQGHIYHIKKTKEITGCDCLVVILSGCFTQRGLPSLLSIQDKTRLALDYGANLVLECPSCYCMQSADYFAKYNIESLASLPIDTLSFGSETNDISYLEHQLSLLENIEIDPSKSLNHNIEMSLRPNDILGMQYIRYCHLYGIHPVSIQRNDKYKSATQTRKDYFEGKKECFDSLFLKEQNWNSYYPFLKNVLSLTDPKDLTTYFLVNEGIENRLCSIAQKANTWDDFLNQCITKNYSRARIQRICLMILLQIKKEEMKEPSFSKIKVLGFDSIGQKCLKQADSNKIITRFNQLDPFLQKVERNSWILYNSVLNQPLDKGAVILYDR